MPKTIDTSTLARTFHQANIASIPKTYNVVRPSPRKRLAEPVRLSPAVIAGFNAVPFSHGGPHATVGGLGLDVPVPSLPCRFGDEYVVGGPSDRFATVGEALRDAEARGYCRVDVVVRPYNDLRTGQPEVAFVTRPTTVRSLGVAARIGTSFRNLDGHRLTIENTWIRNAPGYGVYQRGGILNLTRVRVHGIEVPVVPGSPAPVRGFGVGIDFGGAGAVGRWNHLQVSGCARGGIRVGDNAWVAGGPITVRGNRSALPIDSVVSSERVFNTPGAVDVRDGASLGAQLDVRDNELYGITLHNNARLWMLGSRVGGTHIGRLAGTTVPGSAGPGPVGTVNVLVVDSECFCNSFEIDGRSPIGDGRQSDVGLAVKRQGAVLFDGSIMNCAVCVVFDSEVEDAFRHDEVRFSCTTNQQSRSLPVPATGHT